jgi:peroxiredoxin family protein
MSPDPRTALAAPEIREVVAAEVERQMGALRADLDDKLAEVRSRTVDDRATLVVFSCDLDRALAAFVIATGAAAAGLQTSMFFTFWGLAILKRKVAPARARNLTERLLALVTPGSSESLGLSRCSFGGLGARMLRKVMKDKTIVSLEELMQVARELDVRMIACTMSMDAMGVGREELMDGLDYGGVATYLADAARSRVTLFI